MNDLNLIDKDLQSVQEVRILLRKAKAAQKKLAEMNQDQIDAIVKAVYEETYKARVMLAKMAHEETGFGKWKDKVLKNAFASRGVYEYIKNKKTVGVISDDPVSKVMEVAVPVGVIAGLVPSTNPTSTVIYKTLIALKAANAIVFSPHPTAVKCIGETVRIIKEALASVGAPEDVVACMSLPTMEGTSELMKSDDTDLILATGGSAMVKAAYSSGTPALGVGPGNGPAYIERSANVPSAIKRIMDSKTFDNGTICASEQSIIAETVNKEAIKKELVAQGAYLLNPEEAAQLSKFILRANGTMNPAIVGKSVQTIAQLAGLTVPADRKLLVAEETEVGPKHPYSKEKLAPIIALYTVDNWQEACDLSIRILEQEGAGHTLIIHTENKEVVKNFGLRKPVSRLLVNTPGSLGGIGATTNITPALTLGCGAVGGSATSDNVGPDNLFNLRRVAYGVTELDDLKAAEGIDSLKDDSASTAYDGVVKEEVIRSIVEQVIQHLK